MCICAMSDPLLEFSKDLFYCVSVWVSVCMCVHAESWREYQLSGVAGFCMTSSHQYGAGTLTLEPLLYSLQGMFPCMDLNYLVACVGFCVLGDSRRCFSQFCWGLASGLYYKQAGALLLNHTPALLEKFHKVCLPATGTPQSVFLGYFCILGEQFSWMCQTWLTFLFLCLSPPLLAVWTRDFNLSRPFTSVWFCFSICLFVSMFRHECSCLQKPKEDSSYPGAEATGRCVLSGMGAGKQTCFFCKGSSMCS